MAIASSCVWVNTASAVAWSPSIRWLNPTNSASPGRSELSPGSNPMAIWASARIWAGPFRQRNMRR